MWPLLANPLVASQQDHLFDIPTFQFAVLSSRYCAVIFKMVLLEATLCFTGAAIIKGVTTLYVRHDNNNEYDKMKNYAPLLVFEKLDREKHAAEYVYATVFV